MLRRVAFGCGSCAERVHRRLLRPPENLLCGAMTGPDPELCRLLSKRIIGALEAGNGGLLIVGLCGAQGSGKSTLAMALAARLERAGFAAAVLSLDDFYLTSAQRQELARRVNPLLATRGVPGTHDVALGMATLDALARGEAVPLPRFDKGRDDRAPRSDWPLAPAGTQVLLLEGWCVGARPQAVAELAEPINALERNEDPDGVWRSYANAALGGDYQALFARIDLLILLAAPNWEVVEIWREQQEAELREIGGARVMNPAEVRRFIQHYERLTRSILTEMQQRADVVVLLDADRQPTGPC